MAQRPLDDPTPAAGARPPRGGRGTRAARTTRSQRQTAVSFESRRDGRSLWLGWGEGLTRAEKDRIKARLALLSLSGVIGLVVLVIAGTLLWDKVYYAQRPILRLDGRPVSLQAYTNLLTFHRNRLELQFFELNQLAGQGGANSPFAQLAQQQLAQLQSRLQSLNSTLPEEIVEEQLIRAEAAKRGLTVTSDEVDTRLKELVGYQDPNAVPTPAPTVVVPTPAEGQPTAAPSVTPGPTAAPTRTPTRADRRNETFDIKLRDYRRLVATDEKVIRSQVELDLVRRKLFDELGKDVPATGEQVHARHILVADEGVANTTVERLKAGESFEALAAELSLDTSNSGEGGDLGWFGRGAMVGEFETAAFQLQPGQISAPVKTQFGWHIIRVDERDSNRALEGSALDQAKNAAIQKWLEQEKTNHRIERLLTPDMAQWAERNIGRPASARRA
jgi:parvulin-like peptidyl-prolyl isomerase